MKSFNYKSLPKYSKDKLSSLYKVLFNVKSIQFKQTGLLKLVTRNILGFKFGIKKQLYEVLLLELPRMISIRNYGNKSMIPVYRETIERFLNQNEYSAKDNIVEVIDYLYTEARRNPIIYDINSNNIVESLPLLSSKYNTSPITTVKPIKELRKERIFAVDNNGITLERTEVVDVENNSLFTLFEVMRGLINITKRKAATFAVILALAYFRLVSTATQFTGVHANVFPVKGSQIPFIFNTS